VAGDGHSSGTLVAKRLARPTRMAMRKRIRPHLAADRPSLLGLAPGGVYPAVAVAGGAVRSYRTISPLPRRPKASLGGVFLWHCPWGRPRRPLAGTVSPWSPDFPHPAQERSAAIRPSGEAIKGKRGRDVKPPPRPQRCVAAFHRRRRHRNSLAGSDAERQSTPAPCARPGSAWARGRNRRRRGPSESRRR
jgi:hypothetical protein